MPQPGSGDAVAGTFDVAGRLAEGRPVVDDLTRYAAACQELGACGYDLTERVEQAYAAEAGLDLHALDDDHAALLAALTEVREAQQRQDAQLSALSAAWAGAGADAAADVLRRHGDASSQVVSALEVAAEQVGALRDDLWRLVDAKVAGAEEVDARTAGVRGQWRAAAETVTTGMGDRSAASELVDAEVAPFVERDVRAEWVAAMESAGDAMAQRFDGAVSAVRAGAPAPFPEAGGGPGTAPGAPPPAPTAPMAGTALPDMGSGLSGMSGSSGIGQQLGEMIGGLVPTIGDALGEMPDPDEDPEEDPDVDEEQDEPDEEEDKEQDEAAEPAAEPTAEQEPEPVPVPEPDAPEPEPPAPTPAPAEPLTAPVAPVPEPTAGTPCEIAADELPQVGE